MESGGSKTLWPLNKIHLYNGADTQNRTGDLILTKDALYRLSYISKLGNSLSLQTFAK